MIPKNNWKISPMQRFSAPFMQPMLWNCPQFYRWVKYLKEGEIAKIFIPWLSARIFCSNYGTDLDESWNEYFFTLIPMVYIFFWNLPIPWGTLTIDKIRKFYTFSEKSLKSTMKQWLKNLCDEISSFLDVRNRGLLIFETQWYFLRYCWLIKRI